MSYVWGDPDDKTNIFCHRRRIRVPWNLHDALERVRFPDKSRILWADSICINQYDIKERGHQVQLMRQIFYRADNVNAWLGRGDGFDVKAAFNLIQRLHEACKTNNPRVISQHIDHTPQSEWDALHGLRLCDYFYRVWILQEMGLAYNVTFYCGHNTLQAKALESLKRAWMINPGVNNVLKVFQGLVQQMQFGFRNNTHQDMRYIFYASRYCGCVDPRDRYYGMLGHATLDLWQEKSNGVPFLTVDYTLPTETVYFDAAQRLLSFSYPLKLLSLVQHSERNLGLDMIPSWVPQLHNREQGTCLAAFRANSYFTAGTHEPSSFQQKDQELCVTGVCIDSIGWTSAPINLIWSDSSTVHATLRSAWETIKIAEKNERRSLLRRFCSTLTANFNYQRGVNSKKLEEYINMVVRDCVAFLKIWADCHDELIDWNTDNGGGDAARFMQTVDEECEGRRFFISTKGFFGLCPHVAEPGDDICIFFGAEVPFILTPTDQADKHWLRGECYLEEWMYGKATDMWGPDEGKTFTLV